MTTPAAGTGTAVTAAAPVATVPSTPTPEHRGGRRRRVVAIDVVRGFSVVILLVAVHPGPREGLPAQLAHAPWTGLTFADTIFPLFLFAVGASMPFSARAATPARMLRRVTLLTLIGVALVSIKAGELTLPGVLQHIAFAYLFAWLVLRAPRRLQAAMVAAIVGGAWLAYELVHHAGVDPYGTRGTFAHLANEPFFGRFATEGVPQTVISTVNVLAGAAAGGLVARGADGQAALRRVVPWAAACIALGLAMAPFVPVNKYLWTPSFAVLTAGTSFAYFAIALWLVDVKGWAGWTRPVVILGSNAIAIYVFTLAAGALFAGVFRDLSEPLAGAGDVTVAVSWAVAWLLLGYALCAWMYRRRLFIKV